MSQTIKLIQLEDQYIDRSHQFPYVHSHKSRIRFRLRSKLTYDHQPILLIEKLEAFDYLLPLKGNADISSPTITSNYMVLRGEITNDGSWVTQLPELNPGVISFQLVFVKRGQNLTVKKGTHDIILLCQQKVQLRKLRKMTVFARCIGRHTEWQSFFKSQNEIGYNAFHFAPIQQTGGSNSYYSLKNHLQLSSVLFNGTKAQKYTQLDNILTNLRKKDMVFFIDIILNHTSYDSQWVKSSPDAVFTVENTPLLYSAFLVDQAIYEWGEGVKEMISSEVEPNEDILKTIQQTLLNNLNELKLYEYFQLSDELQCLMLSTVQPRKPSENIFAKDPTESISQFLALNCAGPNDDRNGVGLKDIDQWINLNLAYEESDLKRALKQYDQNWKNKLEEEWVPEIVKNTINEVKSNYFDNSYRQFDDPYPLVKRYFSRVNGCERQFFAINNGWVGGADSREVFVLSKEYYYLRRRVYVWGDLLRVRYGNVPSDSPQAWAFMLEYIRQMAKYFDGFRMDNLHGTQLNVAKYMIKEARKVNPNLIVFAQLFTSSVAETATFTKQVGINSILKEAQYMTSGPSFIKQFNNAVQFRKPYLGALSRYFSENGQQIKYSIRKKPIYLVYDLTHDNQTYIQKKKQVLQTPITVAISLLGTFTGSTKGYDQFYSKKINVTQLGQLYKQDIRQQSCFRKEDQTYLICYGGKIDCNVLGSWDGWKSKHKLTFDPQSKMYYIFLSLPPGSYEYKFENDNTWFLEEGKEYNQKNNHFFVISKEQNGKTIYKNMEMLRKQVSKYEKYFQFNEYLSFHLGNIVVIIRQPRDHTKSICMIANLSTTQEPLTNEIQLVGNITSANIWVQSQLSIYEGFTTLSEIQNSTNIHQFFDVSINKKTSYNVLRAPFLPPGFVCLLQCKKFQDQAQIIQSINTIIQRDIDIPKLRPLELNSILFNCTVQQQYLYGQSNYSIPQSNNRQFVYAGFAGVYQILVKAKRENRLQDGLFANLREGNWLLDYYICRLKRHKHMKGLVQYLENIFNIIGMLPRYLIPRYFTDFVYKFITTIMSQTGGRSDFERYITVASTQFINNFPNASLGCKVLFSAGLPHFAVGWARCWGRDTFTCVELLLVHPQICKDTILQFASALRHGLIPNLLNEGRRPRYNSRDACWWFIRAISLYIKHTNDHNILKTKVQMIFLSNDIIQHNNLKNTNIPRILLLEEIVQLIFQSHVNGISFRQWNAGYEIDSNMSTEGFNVNLDVDIDTGFILGGNPYNCLTWMDKMGSSSHAGTKGVPATPRAGSPVQLVGLLYYCLISFQELNSLGHFSFSGVNYQGNPIKYEVWSKKIKQNFQYQYFLSQKLNKQTHYIQGIYKDLVGSPLNYDEERFRPNALIALAVAPQLFNQKHAQLYILKVEEHLINSKSIGVSTLANVHSPYAPYYDNSDDSSNAVIAHGYSYHNGPEWVWLYGFYLAAKINVQRKSLTRKTVMSLLQNHIKYLQNDQWLSLPELTNCNGQFNSFSCNTQAWSISSILMALKLIETLPNDI